jgi:NAD(P)-dependent dehydrogenase (short-subunit alcohol dehydrogenase family)
LAGCVLTTGNKQVVVAPLDLSDQASVAAFVSAWSGPLHMLVNNAGIMALAAGGGARIVAVSSVGHINGNVDFDDINFARRPYDPWLAYGQSKTANILFAIEAAKR